jgi:mono/diheme cytochrome c family protein
MSKTFIGILVILATAAMVPFGMIALSRSRPSPLRPVHLILDMVRQPKFKAQSENPMFADGRAMRPLIAGVEARGDLAVPNEVLNDPAFPRPIDGRQKVLALEDAASYDRIVQGFESKSKGERGWVAIIPLPVSADFMQRGRERFNVYCAPCHGLSGYGDGPVARRAAEMQAAGADTASGWVAPTSYHSDEIRGRPVGNLYNTVTNGIRTMPAYDKQISVLDRWAIVAYLKALQRSQHAKPGDVPETEQDKYK